MTQAISVREIFADAHQLHAQALRMLDQGDLRDASEKAWCAVKRSSDALILARTGREVRYTSQTSAGLRDLTRDCPDVAELNLRERYLLTQGSLHGDCFYMGIFDLEQDGPRIHSVRQYILDAEQLPYS